MIKKGEDSKPEISIEKYLKKKNIKKEFGTNRNHIMPKETKQRLKLCQKNYRETKKS